MQYFIRKLKRIVFFVAMPSMLAAQSSRFTGGPGDGHASKSSASIVVSVSDQESAATTTSTMFRLMPNYPNPFNPQTTISYEVAIPTQVRLSIFNIKGQQIATLVDAFQPEGSYSVKWDGQDAHGKPLPSGVYAYKFSTPGFSQIRKLTLLR